MQGLSDSFRGLVRVVLDVLGEGVGQCHLALACVGLVNGRIAAVADVDDELVGLISVARARLVERD